MIYLKIALCGISAALMWRQVRSENKELAIYWELVAVYWLLNALSEFAGV